MSELLVWGIVIAVNLPVFIVYGRFMYGSRRDFLEAVRATMKPGMFSLVDGTYYDDLMKELKLVFYFATCGGLLALEYEFILAPWLLAGGD